MTSPSLRRPSRYGRRRAATLAVVYLLMAAHLVHWKLADETLAPLELNEVMHTLELGIVTAGFILMAAALLSVLIFGRFFCSWGCHILALEDLCAWLLAKIGIRPRPVRSRLLLVVPPLALGYMFVWPQVKRLLVATWPSLTATVGEVPTFAWRLQSDTEGWASFMTTDYARNLPGPGIALITFLLCGFVMVWVLGSRSFCTYACPYGALFGLADRVAPGRIVLRGDCTNCGLCTSHCDSDIDVHDEVRRFGKVVHPGCLKDLDCVSVCPTKGLKFGFTKPSWFHSWSKKGRRPVRPGVSWGEDIAGGVAVVLALLIFRGLYESVPFLMTLGLGCLLALVTVTGLRLLRKPHVRFQGILLKAENSITRAGKWATAALVTLLVFVAHSAVMRFHEVRSVGRYEAVCAVVANGPIRPEDPRITKALDDHRFLSEWGLYLPEGSARRYAELALYKGSATEASKALRRVIEHAPDDPVARLRFAQTCIRRGRAAAAQTALKAALDNAALHPDPKHIRLSAWTGLGELMGDTGRYGESVRCFEEAVALDTGSAQLRFNLGVMLGASGKPTEAIASLRAAERITPRDPDIHHHLARLFAQIGNTVDAAKHRATANRLAARRR